MPSAPVSQQWPSKRQKVTPSSPLSQKTTLQEMPIDKKTAVARRPLVSLPAPELGRGHPFSGVTICSLLTSISTIETTVTGCQDSPI